MFSKIVEPTYRQVVVEVSTCTLVVYTVTMARSVPGRWRSVPVLLLCTLSPWQGVYLVGGGQYLYSCCVHCHHGKEYTWQVEVSTCTLSPWQGVYLSNGGQYLYSCCVHCHHGKECTWQVEVSTCTLVVYTVTMARSVPGRWRSVPVLLLCTLSLWQGVYLASGGQYLYSCCVHCHHGKYTWQVEVSTCTLSPWQGVYLSNGGQYLYSCCVHCHHGKECTWQVEVSTCTLVVYTVIMGRSILGKWR